MYQILKSLIKKRYGQDAVNVGDEGGFAPNIQDNREGLDLLVGAIDKAGYSGKVRGSCCTVSSFGFALTMSLVRLSI